MNRRRSAWYDIPRGGHQVMLAVDDGRVACPDRGQTDIEACFFCAGYLGLQEGVVERLVCAGTDRGPGRSGFLPLEGYEVRDAGPGRN